MMPVSQRPPCVRSRWPTRRHNRAAMNTCRQFFASNCRGLRRSAIGSRGRAANATSSMAKAMARRCEGRALDRGWDGSAVVGKAASGLPCQSCGPPGGTAVGHFLANLHAVATERRRPRADKRGLTPEQARCPIPPGRAVADRPEALEGSRYVEACRTALSAANSTALSSNTRRASSWRLRCHRGTGTTQPRPLCRIHSS